MYASEMIREATGYPGQIQESLVDLERFAPRADNSASTGFTIGRLSRAVDKKHHPEDPALYRQLAEHGCRVRIMGAAPFFTAELDGLEAVTLLPVFAQAPELFLQSLDCFFIVPRGNSSNRAGGW